MNGLNIIWKFTWSKLQDPYEFTNDKWDLIKVDNQHMNFFVLEGSKVAIKSSEDLKLEVWKTYSIPVVLNTFIYENKETHKDTVWLSYKVRKDNQIEEIQ